MTAPDAPRPAANVTDAREALIDHIGRAAVIARLAVDGEQVGLGRSAVESIADHLLHAGYRLPAGPAANVTDVEAIHSLSPKPVYLHMDADEECGVCARRRPRGPRKTAATNASFVTDVLDRVQDELQSYLDGNNGRISMEFMDALATALAEAGIGPVAEAEQRGAEAVLAAVEAWLNERASWYATNRPRLSIDEVRAAARAAAERAGGGQ